MAETEGKSEVKPRRKRSTQREMAMRDARLIRALATGQSIEELAAQEGVSLAPGAGARLGDPVPHRRSAGRIRPAANPAPERGDDRRLCLAEGRRSRGRSRRVIKLTREFDRYAGFASTVPAAAPPAAAALPAPPLSLPPPPLAPAQNDEATALGEDASD